MITEQVASDLLQAFFTGQSPFTATAELTGHASSKVQEIFLDWFREIQPKDRETVVNALLDLTLDRDDLEEHLPAASALLAEVTSNYPQTFSRANLERLERYALRGDNLSQWIQDQDSDSDTQKNYRSRWRFVLCLWNVLYVLRSPRAQELYVYLSTRSRDEFFVQALSLAKRFRDNPGLLR